MSKVEELEEYVAEQKTEVFYPVQGKTLAKLLAVVRAAEDLRAADEKGKQLRYYLGQLYCNLDELEEGK